MSPQTRTDRLPGRIIQVPPERHEDAAALLADGSADAGAGLLDYAASQQIDLSLMYAMETPGPAAGSPTRLIHAALAVPNRGNGGVGMVFSSPPGGSMAAQRQLGLVIARATSAMAAIIPGVLAQTLIDTDDRARRAAYGHGGFRHLAQLNYLERPTPTRRSAPPAPTWPPEAGVIPYQSAMRDALAALLDATYEDTLDCPGLCGLRTPDQILAGHEATGVFDPALWSILHLDGVPSGAILLNPSVAGDQIELVYMGLVKGARGRGLGRRLLDHGLNIIAGRTEAVVTLAVDAANAPALQLYRGAGFATVLERAAMIRSFT